MTTVTLPTNKAQSLVSGKFSSTRSFADSAYADAVAALNSLGNTSYFSSFNVSNTVDVPTVDFAVGMSVPDKPDTSIDFTGIKPELALNPVSIASGITIPDFTALEPTINTIASPVVTNPTDPGSGPILEAISLPTEPTIITPTLQETPDIILPVAPDDPPLRTLEDDLIDIDLIDLANNFVYNEQEYDSELADAMYAWLLARVNNEDSTGLGAAVEAALWNRMRGRNDLKNEQTYNEAENYYASRGFVLPPGALSARLTEARAEISRSEDDMNNDITIEMARLAQTNTHFVINASLQDEKQLMDNFNMVADRAFKVAAYVAEIIVKQTEANIAIYNLRLENRKIAALVFSERVKADLIQLEAYKTKMEGAKLEAEVKIALTEVYKSKIEAERLKVQIYSIQMESAKLMSDLQRNEIEKYKAVTDAYVAKVNANTAKYNQYAAEVAAESEKVKIYQTQAGAYEARVRGLSIAGDIEIKNITAQIEHNDGLIKEFTAKMDSYIADSERAYREAETIARTYGIEIEGYRAGIQAETAVADIGVKQAGLQIEARRTEILSAIEEAKVGLEEGRQNYQFDMSKFESIAKISSQMAASALTSVNASAQIGFNTGASASGDMTKDIWSYSENYNHG